MLGDPHLGFVAYVPPGAIARGQGLAAHGVAAQQPCSACHGAGLKGSDEAPPLAGRSPTYLARQLWDFHTGARHNTAAAPMRIVAAGLDAPQIVDLVAYLASLKP
jgi:cytochrome c553